MTDENRAVQDLKAAIARMLETFEEQGQAHNIPFPPDLDDLTVRDFILLRWRVEAPPRQVEQVRRMFGEAYVTLLYAESDAIALGDRLDDEARHRLFYADLRDRLIRLITDTLVTGDESGLHQLSW